MRNWIFSSTLILLSYCSWAQKELKRIPIEAPETFATDENGNVYLGSKSRAIIKWDRNGDSLRTFRMVRNGNIHHIDATNPLEILIVQPGFSRVMILDRMLSPKTELDLARINILNAGAVANSQDGKYWIYDNINSRLIKIDDQLRIVLESNDSRLQEDQVLVPTHIEERNERVVITDPDKGIIIFDRYGSLVNTLEIKGVSVFQLYEDQLVYLQNDSLQSYDFRDRVLRSYAIPTIEGKVIGARIERNRLYVLSKEYLYIYEL